MYCPDEIDCVIFDFDDDSEQIQIKCVNCDKMVLESSVINDDEEEYCPHCKAAGCLMDVTMEILVGQEVSK